MPNRSSQAKILEGCGGVVGGGLGGVLGVFRGGYLEGNLMAC